MTSRIFAFDDAKYIPDWQTLQKVKSATWVKLDDTGMYSGFLELVSPQKITCCMKMFNATWQKCNRSKHNEYARLPQHVCYIREKTDCQSIDETKSQSHIIDELREEVCRLKQQVLEIKDKSSHNYHTTIYNTTINNTKQ